VKEGAKAVAAGMKRGIDLAVEAVKDLQANSKKVTSNDEIARSGPRGPGGSRSPAPVIDIPCLCGYVSTAIEIRYCPGLRQRRCAS